jgi:hypothetical protein
MSPSDDDVICAAPAHAAGKQPEHVLRRAPQLPQTPPTIAVRMMRHLKLFDKKEVEQYLCDAELNDAKGFSRAVPSGRIRCRKNDQCLTTTLPCSHCALP